MITRIRGAVRALPCESRRRSRAPRSARPAVTHHANTNMTSASHTAPVAMIQSHIACLCPGLLFFMQKPSSLRLGAGANAVESGRPAGEPLGIGAYGLNADVRIT